MPKVKTHINRYSLADTEHRQKRFLDLSPDPITILEDENCVLANPAFTQLFGYTKKDIANGLSFMELVQDKDKNWLKTQHKEPPGSKIMNRSHIRLLTKEHKLVPCQLSAAPIHYNDIASYLVIIHDRSHYYRAEKNIADHLHFEMILSHISATFINTPAEKIDEEITCALKQILKFLRVDRCALFRFDKCSKNLRLTHYWPPKQKEIMTPFILCRDLPYAASRLYAGKVFMFNRLSDLPEEAVKEKRFARREGIKSNISIPLTMSGKLLGALGMSALNQRRYWSEGIINRFQLLGEIITNALDRRQTDEAIKKYFSGIERDVLKRKEIECAKTEFLSLASHQFRTPLTSINLSIEMLLNKKACAITDKQKSYLTEIHKDISKMSALVETMLNISKIETGAFIPKFRPVNIMRIIDSVIVDMKILIRKKKIKIEKCSDTDVPVINADWNILKVVFENLLSNAIKYSPSGEKIDINLKLETDKIVFSIKDSGAGIPKDEQPKIFSRYTRGNNIIKHEASGAGLGLYIAKSLIKGINGSISFKSREGQGSTFYITLPIEKNV